MAWTIELKASPLKTFCKRLYLEIFNDKGHRVAQISAFASSPETDIIRRDGQAGDVLRAYIGNKFIIKGTNKATRYNHRDKGVEIFEGNEQAVRELLSTLKDRVNLINKKNIPYDYKTRNTNSIISSLVKVISDSADINEAGVDRFMSFPNVFPGVRNHALSPATRNNPMALRSSGHTG